MLNSFCLSSFIVILLFKTSSQSLDKRHAFQDGSEYTVLGNDRSRSEMSLEDSFKSLAYSPQSVLHWPNNNIPRGALSAVSVDTEGNVVVFQRGNHVWDEHTFDINEVYVEKDDGPITNNTILVYNATTGNLIRQWGNNTFYMPHGLTVDHENNVWVTDVALHQVFKFSPDGSVLKLTMGTRFVPGRDSKHFCKPTSVAVLRNGDFFVADGYCNSRIIKYSNDGKVILQWGRSTFQTDLSSRYLLPYSLSVPHSLTVVEDLNLLCVADRENGRIQCYNSDNGTFVRSFHHPVVGAQIFAVAYNPIDGGQLYIVNGPHINNPYSHTRGFVINLKSKKIVSQFGPSDTDMMNPHDLAVSKDGSQIYVVELTSDLYKFRFPGNKSLENKDAMSASPNSTYQVMEQPVTIVSKSSLMITVLIVLIVFIIFASVAVIIGAVIIKLRKRVILTLTLSFALSLSCALRANKQRWAFKTTDEKFKFSHLLERHKHTGFEQLNTEESDEDAAGNSSTLPISQYA